MVFLSSVTSVNMQTDQNKKTRTYLLFFGPLIHIQKPKAIELGGNCKRVLNNILHYTLQSFNVRLKFETVTNKAKNKYRK